MPKKRQKSPRRQVGAAPYRVQANGEFEILLVTTRETGRWIVPKGWLIQKRGSVGTAELEAFEEAGIRGDFGPALGAFRYMKVLRSGPDQLCEVEIFPLYVRELLEEWPEKHQRERRWFSPADASAAVDEPDLAALLAELPQSILRVEAAAAGKVRAKAS